jgi:hypothetical protein
LPPERPDPWDLMLADHLIDHAAVDTHDLSQFDGRQDR